METSGFQNDPVLSILANRQYLDWRPLRHREINSTEARETIERFGSAVCQALFKPSKLPVTMTQRGDAAQPLPIGRKANDQGEQSNTTDKSLQRTGQEGHRDVVRERKGATQPPTDGGQYSRTSPEYWLKRVAVDRKLIPGDQPLVVISFASEDQPWVDDLRTFLDPKIELLRDQDGAAYHLWNFSDAKRGTSPGDEFPEIVAEKMWRCRAALLLLSSNFFKSSYCRVIELPFLMWRRDHHKLMCLPLKLGTIPVDRVRLPNYETPSRTVVIGELIDDRQAAEDFANSRYRDWNLKQLREERIESEIEKRFEGISRHVAEFLKRTHGAVELE